MGGSNLTAELLQASLDAAASLGVPRYEVLQNEYSLIAREGFEAGLADLCVREQVGFVSYYSLASGFLTGKYRSKADLSQSARGGGVEKYLTPRGLRILDALDAVAAGHGAKPAEAALAWLMHRPGVTAPIASATSVAQVESLARACALALSEADMAALNAASA